VKYEKSTQGSEGFTRTLGNALKRFLGARQTLSQQEWDNSSAFPIFRRFMAEAILSTMLINSSQE
jgi:hypothetical protein